MSNKNSDEAMATDTISTEEIEPTAEDPTVHHFLEAMQETATSEGKEQRKVIGTSEIDGVTTERVLIVKPDGSHTVEESTK